MTRYKLHLVVAGVATQAGGVSPNVVHLDGLQRTLAAGWSPPPPSCTPQFAPHCPVQGCLAFLTAW
jgi:hypothetical protein